MMYEEVEAEKANQKRYYPCDEDEAVVENTNSLTLECRFTASILSLHIIDAVRGFCDKNHGWVEAEEGQVSVKVEEELEIELPNAVRDKAAMVVHSHHASIAEFAVVGAGRLHAIAALVASFEKFVFKVGVEFGCDIFLLICALQKEARSNISLKLWLFLAFFLWF